ncbi:hypothetical protein D3C71_1327040 [compost metagenome]
MYRSPGRRFGDRGFHLCHALVHQVETHMRPVAVRVVVGSGLRQPQHRAGDIAFADVRQPRDLLHHMPVTVAGAEVHQGIGAGRILLQDAFDHAHAFNELAPIHVGQEAQTADAVADRNLVRRLLLALQMHQLFDAMAVGSDPLFKPGDRHREHTAAPLQPTRQFGNEGTRQRWPRARQIGDHQHHILRAFGRRLVQALGPFVRQAAIGAVMHHAHGHAPQIVDQGQPQHDRYRP